MTGFDNGILIAYGMCPLCTLPEYYQMDPTYQPIHFMRGTVAEIWGTDTHEVMCTTVADLDFDDQMDKDIYFSFLLFVIELFHNVEN